ncbi:MAG: YkvA family protein [Prochlorothrix sp.]|nr:YkvA family protein [Prochlorothrix sp.]
MGSNRPTPDPKSSLHSASSPNATPLPTAKGTVQALSQQVQRWRDRWEPARRGSRPSDPASSDLPPLTTPSREDLEQALQTVSDRLRDFDQRQIQTRLQRITPLLRRFVESAKLEDLPKITQKLPAMDRGPIHDLWPKVQDLAKMVRDPDAAWKSRALAIGALIYLITPFDAIPDVLPGLGLVDDAAVLVSVIATLAAELGQYTQRAAEKGVAMAEELADIEVRKHNRIVRTTLLGSIGAAVLAIVVKLVLNALD